MCILASFSFIAFAPVESKGYKILESDSSAVLLAHIG